jgi:hypothetical protein
LCPSGTFAEEIKAVDGVNVPTLPKANILIETVYTCDDGSGTFFAQKHVFLIINEDGTQTNTGRPITFKGVTGDYVGLSGHGVDTGSVTAEEIGVATASRACGPSWRRAIHRRLMQHVQHFYLTLPQLPQRLTSQMLPHLRLHPAGTFFGIRVAGWPAQFPRAR